MTSFGERIREIRDKRGLSRERIALGSGGGLSKSGLYRIEAESRIDPKASTLIILAEQLRVQFIIDPEGMKIEEL